MEWYDEVELLLPPQSWSFLFSFRFIPLIPQQFASNYILPLLKVIRQKKKNAEINFLVPYWKTSYYGKLQQLHVFESIYVEHPLYKTLWRGCYYRNNNLFERVH